MVKKDLGRIGILMGGPSTEREISLKSGRAVYEHLKNHDLEAVPIDIDTENAATCAEKLKSMDLDVAFIALHGRFGEDGKIQKILEDLCIPYTGSGVMASKLALDKISSRKIFQVYRLSVPSYMVIERRLFSRDGIFINDFGFPLVVKPATHGSSIGLSIVEDYKLLIEAIELAFSFDERVIVEQYLSGRELTVGIIDETPLPVIEIVPKNRFFDYEAKYKPGMTEYIVPANLDKKTVVFSQDAALRAHKSLGCYGFSRVDMILSGSAPYILEVNTIPGMTETSLLPKAAAATGIGFVQLCIRLLELALARPTTETKDANRRFQKEKYKVSA